MADSKYNPNALLSQIASGAKFDPNDSFIAVMGATGSGKSTFISRLCGGGARIGHDLISCTNEIEVFPFKYNDTNVCLIDTPGFDDTYRTDSDVLKEIAFWLSAAYKAHIQLRGIVFLHPIDKNRVTHSAHKNLRMFQKLCGENSLPSVVLATTMWGNVKEADGERREEQLKTRPDFWGNMIAHKSRVFRLEDTRASAMNIINYILDQQRPTVLDIQKQMVDEGKNLDQTGAGQELEQELLKQRELFERRIQEAQEEIRQAVMEGNKKADEEAKMQRARFQKKLEESQKTSNEIQVNMENLMKQKDEEFKRAIKDLEEQMRARSEEEERRRRDDEDERHRRDDEDERRRRDDEDERRRRYREEADDMNIQMSRQNLGSQILYQQPLVNPYWAGYNSMALAQTLYGGVLQGPFGLTPGQSLASALNIGEGVFSTAANLAQGQCNVM